MNNADATSVPDGSPWAVKPFTPALHQQPGTKTGYIGLTDLLRIIRRRGWMIFSLVAITGVLTLAFLARTRPIYTSTAAVMVLPSDQALASTTPNLTPSASDETVIQTKMEVLQSRSIAQRTADALQLGSDPEFAPPTSGPSLSKRIFAYLVPARPEDGDLTAAQRAARARREATIDALVAAISVTRVAHSNVINVAASSVDPAKAARIANLLVTEYLRSEVEETSATRSAQIRDLTKRVDDVRTYLERAETAAAAYRREHGLLNARPEERGGDQASELTGMLTQARAEHAADSRKAKPFALSDGSLSASSILLTDLQQQQALLTRKIAELSSFYGTAYPEVVQATAELAALRKRVTLESGRLKADLRSQASASAARSAVISAAIAGIRSRSFSEGQVAVPLRALERNVEAVNTLYSTLLNQLNAKIGSPPSGSPDLALVSRAPVPDGPSYPLPNRVLAVAMMAALILGVLLAFGIEAMDMKLRTSEQVRRLLGLPTLAMVPEMEEGQAPVYDMVAGRPRSRFAEAMRNLLIELEARMGHGGNGVVVVTSPLEGEGKNTIATSLAAAAAVFGRSAVVVDFDLRRPRLTPVAPQADGAPAGVVAYLSDRAAMADLLPAANDGRFAVIGAGEMAADPGALVSSGRMPELIAQLRTRFELVILNAPPILPVRDAKTLAGFADAVLLVLRWGKTSPEAAMAALEVFDGPITGVVVNRVDYRAHAHRRYGDAIDHVSRGMAYYDAETEKAFRFSPRRLSRWINRRSARLS